MAIPFSNPLDDPHYRSRAAFVLLAALAVATGVLALRLFHLQVLKGSYHAMLSDQNSMRLQVVKAPRGVIYDRHGVAIARNRPSYQIAILPTELTDRPRVLRNLLRFRDTAGSPLFDSQAVVQALERARWRRFQPQVILEDAPFDVVALVEEHLTDLPGVGTLVESRRSYPFGAAAGHALGYMDEVKEEELEAFKAKAAQGDSMPYARGDRLGRKGLERQYERFFRGRDGIRYVKVNAFGREVETIEEMPRVRPVPGMDLHTSLDMDLQVHAESLLADTVRGAVVALDPRNGEILVLASSPRMDGNIFSLSRERRSKEWARLALDSARPLNNRALSGGYEPASTFKGVMSLAALQSGRVRLHEHMPKSCTGGYRFGNRVWRCWDEKGHGFTDALSAFMMSCDVYYYQVGLLLGMDRINAMARRFGFGEVTGVDLDDERAGMLMDSALYTRRFGKRGWRWTRGLILNLSIGQGQIVTPIQLANYAAGLANGHAIYRPHLLREMRDAQGYSRMRGQAQVLHELNLRPEEHAAMLKAMDMVVNGPRGTGGRARVPGVHVGGKTGSAENPHGGLTHALFIGVAPLDAPRIAVAVVLENVGHGGSMAAPIAGSLLKRFFQRHARG